MPSWKKVITSGSDAHLKTIKTDGNISGSSVSTGSFGRVETSTISGLSPLVIEADNVSVDDDGSVSGSSTSTGSFAVYGNDFIPSEDNTHDLGSSGNEWKDLYVDGTAYLDAIQMPHEGKIDFGGGDGIIEANGNNNQIYLSRIASGGNVGIYQTNPQSRLDINGDLNVNTHITASGNISGSSTSTGSFGRLEAQTISASRVDVDAGTLAIGGTSINKTVADNIQNTSGTNTGDITLAGGSKDFIQLTNQVVTVNQVDLTDDVTGVLPSANLDSDTAHLTTTQTFSGIKTFSAPITASLGVSGSASSTGSFGKVSIGSTGLAQSGSELFEVKGNLGTLFTITDEMSGSIFSANTIAGIPVIEAFSDQTVRLGPLANQVEVGLGGHITSSANISSSATLIGANISSSGDIVADGDVVAYNSSDMRLKNNLKVIEGALDKIDGIAGYEFDWNDNSPGWARERGHDVGVVAQEIEKIHPEIVEERKNGYLGVDYKRLVPLLIQSIKELKQEVEELKKKV